MRTHLAIAAGALVIASAAVPSPSAAAEKGLPLSLIKLPPGFRIEIFAENLPEARSMTLSPKGTLFVGSRKGGLVRALVTRNGGAGAGEVFTIARGLHMPNGVAFRDGSLFVAEVSRISRFDHIEDHLRDPPKPAVVYDALPKFDWHGWKFIAFGPDGLLYVPIGAPCNICEVRDPLAGIARMKPDGTAFDVYARGVRNSVGFDWQPSTKELYFTDNGVDEMGDDIPPDELDHAPKPGLSFGFPFCHGGDLLDPKYGKGHKCSEFVPPVVKFPAHVAALGMRFYTGSMFPPEYKDQIFVAEHGSWNRSVPIGYRIELVRLHKDGHAAREIFAEGWLQDGKPWGRPVDVLVMPDGALLVSDDHAGVIYRISYKAP